MKRIIFPMFLILLCFSVSAADYPLTHPYINDFANLLTPAEENKLDHQAAQIEQETKSEIAIVTVQTTNGEDRTLYANHLGEAAGVGKARTDNGVVVLWSIENEHGGAIATGRGIESVLTDAKVTAIGRETRPLFDQGEYYQAFSQILTNLNIELNTNDTATIKNSSHLTVDELFGGHLLLVLIISSLIMWFFFRNRSSSDDSDSDSDSRSSSSDAFITGAVVGSALSHSRWRKKDTSDDEEDDDSSSSSYNGGGGGSFGGGSFGGSGGSF